MELNRDLTNQFGKAALLAVELCKTGLIPLDAWKKAICEFSCKEGPREKTCPKNTFLGLCSEGLITAIPQRDYGDSKERVYARQAVEYLKKNPQSAPSPAELWKKVMELCNENADKHHDGQMNVVMALWEKGVLR